MSKVLIIDDDVILSGLFQDYLEEEKFQVRTADTATEGLQLALQGDFDIVILDVMLPDMSGTEVLKLIRQQSHVPILMFTAKGDDVDRIMGLESGADDYVPKPCTPRELIARIKAILRRSEITRQQQQDETVIQTGPLQLWPQQRKALWFDTALELTSTEFSLLESLARNAGQVVSKNALSEAALGRPLARFDRSIDVHMSSIRHKLGEQQDGHSYIQTVRGKGYQLIK
ncbi:MULTISPECIES: response regulator transcription factor [unclassified Methylophaga]|uniref:response regulator transcription factor n=1 Tax=unclassified Methylophaga TaxID=2629249 RepID=UPI000C44B742|nr:MULTISPECIES: response regulator transcription factor [unclassified Methylophaga]MAL48572.1 DNA-binding response regulator [Methylophaga sp.]MAP26221.1 DNA-binding response regulator [Methylophaga sp.]MBP24610.1 DNA-binding response regulator [Methylophaga sp.]MDX1750414.1 response regulator transcription factor [Methylophaga sp.]HAD32039.1 DNA-binding response regulator [Methylophaga sp.]